MRQHARHRVIDGAAETTALGRHVDEGDRRLIVHASVLIHDRLIAFVSIPEKR
jgi:hypothetical protein